ncbi:MAG: hypothetical protein ABJB97_12345 [Acidobacteriota bacterium]
MNNTQLHGPASRGFIREKLPTIGVSIVATAMMLTLALVVWQRSTNPSTVDDYQARVVERWADYVESEQGSRTRFRLLIELQDGKKFIVNVNANVYESTKVGLQVRSRAGQIVPIE